MESFVDIVDIEVGDVWPLDDEIDSYDLNFIKEFEKYKCDEVSYRASKIIFYPQETLRLSVDYHSLSFHLITKIFAHVENGFSVNLVLKIESIDDPIWKQIFILNTVLGLVMKENQKYCDVESEFCQRGLVTLQIETNQDVLDSFHGLSAFIRAAPVIITSFNLEQNPFAFKTLAKLSPAVIELNPLSMCYSELTVGDNTDVLEPFHNYELDMVYTDYHWNLIGKYQTTFNVTEDSPFKDVIDVFKGTIDNKVIDKVHLLHDMRFGGER